MMWIFFILLVALAVMSVLWPLSRPVHAAADADVDFYHAQAARIAQDVQRQLLRAEEAEEAKLMAARLLLQRKDSEARQGAGSKASLLRRRWLAVLTIVMVPAVSLGLYARLGSFTPPQAVQASAPAVPSIPDAVTKIEQHLATHPDDGMGYQVLLPIYERLGRYQDAERAAQKALQLLGETAERQADLAEAAYFAAGGRMNDQARAAVDRALALNPDLPKAVYYKSIIEEQDGNIDQAKGLLKDLLDKAPADAPWKQAVEGRLSKLAQPAASELPANALPMIKSMVAGLAEKLKQNPDDLDGWLRLIRSYAVLHQPDDAKSALRDARAQFAGKAPALAQLNELAKAQGLGD